MSRMNFLEHFIGRPGPYVSGSLKTFALFQTTVVNLFMHHSLQQGFVPPPSGVQGAVVPRLPRVPLVPRCTLGYDMSPLRGCTRHDTNDTINRAFHADPIPQERNAVHCYGGQTVVTSTNGSMRSLRSLKFKYFMLFISSSCSSWPSW